MRWVRWKWIVATVVVATAVTLCLELVPPPIESQEAEHRFLGAQTCDQMSVRLRVDSDELTLNGVARAELSQVGASVRLILDAGLTIDAARFGDVELEEVEPALTEVFSYDRSRRALVAPEGELPASGTLTVEYHGSAVGVTLSDRSQPVPLVLARSRPYVPLLSTQDPDLDLTIDLPESEASPWNVVSGALAQQSGESEWTIRSSGQIPAVVLGPLQSAEITSPPLKIMAASAGCPLPDHATLLKSLEATRSLLSNLLPPEFVVVWTRNAEGVPTRVSDRLLIAPPWRSAQDVVRAIAYGAWVEEGLDLATRRALSEVAGLLGADMVGDATDGRGRVRLDSVGSPQYAGWLAIRADGTHLDTIELLQDWVRDLGEGEVDVPFRDRRQRNLFAWAQEASVAFDNLEVRLVNDRWNVEVRVDVDPEPPGNPPPLALSMVTRDGELRRLDVRWSGSVGTARAQRLASEPVRFVLDADHQFPDDDRSDNVITRFREIEPHRFAVDRESGRVAVAPAARGRSGGLSSAGLYICDLGREDTDSVRWHEMPAPIDSIRWLPDGRFLFLTFQPGTDRRASPVALLDLVDGVLRHFDHPGEPSPGGDRVLSNRRRSPGRHGHLLYDVSRRREMPFYNDLPSRIEWVEGLDAVWGGDGRTRTEIRDLDHGVLAEIERASQDLRLVRHNPRLGFTFVTERADGSTLFRLSESEGEAKVLYRARGRITNYAFSVNPGEIHAFFYTMDETGRTAVHDVILKSLQGVVPYQGEATPLDSIHLPTGLLLTRATVEPELAELHYLPFSASDPTLGDSTRVVAEMLSQPAPVLSDEGRYLYFVRVHDEAGDLAARYRRRSLVRYDFLHDQLESVLGIDVR